MKAGLLYRICDTEDLLQGSALFYTALFNLLAPELFFKF